MSPDRQANLKALTIRLAAQRWVNAEREHSWMGSQPAEAHPAIEHELEEAKREFETTVKEAVA